MHTHTHTHRQSYIYIYTYVIHIKYSYIVSIQCTYIMSLFCRAHSQAAPRHDQVVQMLANQAHVLNRRLVGHVFCVLKSRWGNIGKPPKHLWFSMVYNCIFLEYYSFMQFSGVIVLVLHWNCWRMESRWVMVCLCVDRLVKESFFIGNNGVSIYAMVDNM